MFLLLLYNARLDCRSCELIDHFDTDYDNDSDKLSVEGFCDRK